MQSVLDFLKKRDLLVLIAVIVVFVLIILAGQVLFATRVDVGFTEIGSGLR